MEFLICGKLGLQSATATAECDSIPKLKWPADMTVSGALC